MRNKIIVSLLALLPFFGIACSDFLEPETDNTLTEEEVFKNAAFFCGPLMDAYSAMPTTYNVELENMTDNAVDNDFIGDYYLCGTGALRPDNNPLDNWTNAYLQIRRINQFFQKMVLKPTAKLPTPVRFYVINSPQDSIDNVREFKRLLGEAYFVRAYWQAELLRNFGGIAVDGSMLGVPFVGDRVIEVTEDMNLPRASYADCVQAIINDCDSAISYLPVEYKGNDRVTGESMNGRAGGISAMALKARVLLYAASPAFNLTNDPQLWEKAAVAAGIAIKAVGGVLNLSTIDQYYFTSLNNATYGNRDILFRGPIQTNNRKYEIDNYPQSMYGSAITNPSQNYVDAFPDKNGYPYAESSFDFSANPYANRDPRLALYVAYNGSKMGPSNYHTIASYKGGEDAYDALKKTSRTSYFLKKLLRYGVVSSVPGSLAGTQRAHIILGMPELYLNYAEAANEAWGVKVTPPASTGITYTAYEVFRKIQTRYACGAQYLDNVIGTDQGKFRKYIRNERRLELSFEGHYYYDLRRWIGDKSLQSLNVDVYGMAVTKQTNGTFSYQQILLEKKSFKSPYQPVSYMELYNSSNLVQNYGWE